MPSVPSFVTVRAPRESVWQSVVERVAKRKQNVINQRRAAIATHVAAAAESLALDSDLGHLQDLVNACHQQVFEHDEMRQGRIPTSSALSPESTLARRIGAAGDVAAANRVDTFKSCASVAAQLAEAKVFGPPERVAVLQSVFDFNVCDPFWVECVGEYEKFFTLEQGEIPYRGGLNNLLHERIPATAKIAIFGDWGTGMPQAVSLARTNQIIRILTSSCTLATFITRGPRTRCRRDSLTSAPPFSALRLPRCFSLSGNHDMYSGGAGYYWLVDRLGQGASYFAVQNDDWLFIAMDTGLHDTNPLQGGSAATFVDPREADWVNDLIKGSENQKIVLFSHHPLFSAYDPISGGAVNTLLLEQIRPSLPKLTAWFWGHEHRLAVYDPFLGLARGRCIGHSAIPVFADASGDPPKLAGVPVHREGGELLDMGTNGRIFKHGFAIMTLSGKDASVAFYRQGESIPLWQESF